MKFHVKVIPGAQKTAVVGWLDEGTVKIRLNAQPEKGKANAELVTFLSKKLGVAKLNVVVVKGVASREKLVELPDIDWEQIRSTLI